jgi:hypothetical protein
VRPPRWLRRLALLSPPRAAIADLARWQQDLDRSSPQERQVMQMLAPSARPVHVITDLAERRHSRREIRVAPLLAATMRAGSDAAPYAFDVIVDDTFRAGQWQILQDGQVIWEGDLI